MSALRACVTGVAGVLIGLTAPLEEVIVLAAEPAAVAFPVAEASFGAELAGIDREWNISFKAAGKVRVMGAGELAYWGRWKDVEAGPQIILGDGSVIRADVLLMDEKQIVVGDATGLGRGFWEESSLPRGGIRAMLFQPPAVATERDRIWKEALLRPSAVADSARPAVAPGSTEDRLLLVGSESISGTLVSAPRLGRFATEEAKPGSETFQIVRRGGMQTISVPAGKVVAVQFGAASESTAGQASSGTRAVSESTAGQDSGGTLVWMGLRGGSIVQVSSIRSRGDMVTVALAAGGELKTTLAGRDDPNKRFWDAVTYLESVSARVAWLSDREALGYKQIPFLSVERPPGIDQSVLGTRLRAGGAIFRKGIGMPSASRVAYDVAGYRKFEAEIVIDEAAGLAGSVVFKVVLQAGGGEWRTAYESPVVRGGDAPIPISVELKGVSRMALLVEFAERGDECDYADWLAARLVK